MNCFGSVSREIGHNRVPDPPARMTGTITPENDIVFSLV